MSIIYYIDAENVQLKGILELLKDSSNLVVVVTGVQNKFEDEYKEAQNYKNLDHIHTTKTQKELADKLLLAKLGEYVYRYRARKHVIISKDNDFRDAVKVLNPHWGSDVQILSRYPSAVNTHTEPSESTVQSAPKKKKTSSKTASRKKKTSMPTPPRSPSQVTRTISVDPFSDEARIRRLAERFLRSDHYHTARTRTMTFEEFTDFLLGRTIVSSAEDAQDLIRRLEKVGVVQIHGNTLDWIRE